MMSIQRASAEGVPCFPIDPTAEEELSIEDKNVLLQRQLETIGHQLSTL